MQSIIRAVISDAASALVANNIISDRMPKRGSKI